MVDAEPVKSYLAGYSKKQNVFNKAFDSPAMP